MPSTRRHIGRVAEGDLDVGQRAFLLAEELPEGAGLWAFNRWAWLWNATERQEHGGTPLPDGSPGPRELWSLFGVDAIDLWHQRHGDEPHPLVDSLGLPGAGPRRE